MVKNLRSLRREFRISQQKLADALGVSQQSINKYENHGAEPDIQTLCRMADYFHTTVDYLVGHSDRRDGDNGPPAAETEVSLRGLSDREQELIRILVRECRRLHVYPPD